MAEQQRLSPAENNQLLHSSYLYKRSKSHNWQRRWFVLRLNQLSYYKDSKEHKASKIINIDEILNVSVIPDNHKFHFIVVTNERIYHLKAFNGDDFQKWIELLNEVYTQHNKMFESQSNASVNDSQREKEQQQSQLEKLYQEDQLLGNDGPDFEYSKPVNISDIDFSNFHLAGTDDNFTSGQGSDSNTLNHSSTSLPLAGSVFPLPDQQHQHLTSPPQIPTPILEIEEAETDSSDRSPIETVQAPLAAQIRPNITYYNSFSKSLPEHTITSGPLYRLKKRYNQWRKYHVVLTNQYLYFYKSLKDFDQEKIHKRISLDDVIDVVELDALSKTRVYCMLIITARKRIRFCAQDEESLVSWLVYLKTVLKTRNQDIED